MALKLFVFCSLLGLSVAAIIPSGLHGTPLAVAVDSEYDPHPQYSYAYDVQDALTGDSKRQHESRSGDVVQGSYSVSDPDGTRRTVDYAADPINGFNAVVRREPVVGHVASVLNSHGHLVPTATSSSARVDAPRLGNLATVPQVALAQVGSPFVPSYGQRLYPQQYALNAVHGLQDIRGLNGLQGIHGVQSIHGIQSLHGLQNHHAIQNIQGLHSVQSIQGHHNIHGLQGPYGHQGLQSLNAFSPVAVATGLNGGYAHL